MKTILSVVVLSFLLSGCSRLAQQPDQTAKKTNTYFVAADEVDWNYTPSGIDQMMGMEFMGYAKIVTERGPHRIGTTYKKALYRELWRGDTEPNPFKAQFWSDWMCWLKEHPGYTMGAVVAVIGTAFALARTFPSLAAADVYDLIAAGAAAGWIGDGFNKANPS
mgnify:CR=1 FL=1